MGREEVCASAVKEKRLDSQTRFESGTLLEAVCKGFSFMAHQSSRVELA